MLTFLKKIFHIIINAVKKGLGIAVRLIVSLPIVVFFVNIYKKTLGSEKFRQIYFKLEELSPVLHVPLALSICFLMEWLSRHSFLEAVSFVDNHTKAYLYNSYVIYVVLLLAFISRRRNFTRIIVISLFLILGIINCLILFNRVSPFGFTDLSMIGDLFTMQNTQYFNPFEAFLALLIIGIFAVIMAVYFIKGIKYENRLKFPFRLAIIIFGFISVPITTNLLQRNGTLAAYFGNLSQGYLDYGYLYGFNMSLFSRGVRKPIIYSKEIVEATINLTDMGESGTNGIEGPNVIVVLLESYYDVDETKFIETNPDPIPYFHYLSQEFSSGYLTVPVVGAGTCNTEFEMMTGMCCQFFGPGEYPQKTILKDVESCESIAHTMKSIGYKTHVVHNNGGNFYSRKNAFSKMGFDSFTSKEMLDITDWNPINTWPKDDILIPATKDALDSTPERDFIYTIAVQTHGEYPSTPVFENPEIKVKCHGKTEEEHYRWEYFINMLKDEDRFLIDYVKMLDNRDEPTLVIFFGDHLPTMGLTNEDQVNGDIFHTNYATWNNFGMEKKDADLTSYQLVSEYLDRLGIHGGSVVNYNQYMTRKGISPSSTLYLNGIHTLQYDQLYGKRYSHAMLKEFSASDIEMGIKDIKIDCMYAFNNQLHIYGENFTPWSVVHVGDSALATTYRSGELLTVKLSDLEDQDLIRVCQMGSGNTIFRESNEVTYIENIP